MDVSIVPLKQIKKIIKQHGFKIITLTEEFKAIRFDPDEILFYKYTSTDNIIRISKRIKDNNSAHTIIIDLNNANISKISDFLKKDTYECIVCYETNNKTNENLEFLHCDVCDCINCGTCARAITKCPVCGICIKCMSKGVSLSNSKFFHEILTPEQLYMLFGEAH